MAWSEISPGRYESHLAVTEDFFVKFCVPNHETGREHWTVTFDATLDPNPSPGNQLTRARLLEAWKSLRFEYPALACTLDVQRCRKVFQVPTASDLDLWLSNTFVVISKPTRPEDVVANSNPLPLPVLYFLESSLQIVFQSSHWRIDGIGVMLLMNRFFELLAAPLQPANLKWGEEVKNLPTALEDVLKVPLEGDEKAKECSRSRFAELGASMPTVGVSFKGDSSTLPGRTYREALLFTKHSTEEFVRMTHKQGMTVTAAIQAALVFSTYDVASKPTEKSGYAALAGINLRKYLPDPWGSGLHAVNVYLAGHFVFVPNDEKTTFVDAARSITQQFRTGFVPTDYNHAVREFIAGLTAAVSSPPPPGLPPQSDVSVSSLGKLDQYLRPEYAGPGDAVVRLENVRLGLEQNTRQLIAHIWTWNEQLRVSISFNEAYHDAAFVRDVLRRMKGHLEKGLALQLEAIAAI